VLVRGNLLHDGVERARTGQEPELRDLGLLDGARLAVESTDLANLV
jgi:hypothetical protein